MFMNWELEPGAVYWDIRVMTQEVFQVLSLIRPVIERNKSLTRKEKVAVVNYINQSFFKYNGGLQNFFLTPGRSINMLLD